MVVRMGGQGDGRLPPGDAVVARIGRLCELGVRTAGVDGAGVSVIADAGPQPVLSTDDLSALIEELQFTLGEGPCFNATATQTPVLVSDLADPPGRHRARMAGVPRRGRRRRRTGGVRVPAAGSGPSTIGTLDLYRAEPGPLDRDQLSSTLRTADAVGPALLTPGPAAGRAAGAGWLR